jgi:hypothetical protein
MGPAGSQAWSAFLTGLKPAYVASTFTPGNAIVVTRIQAQLAGAPPACILNAVISVSDGTPGGTQSLPITGTANDSGPISKNYAAGTPIELSVSTAAGCSASSATNVVVQYKGQ